MKRVCFMTLLVLLIVALQAESQNHVTLNLNGDVTGSSNISSNGGHTTYTRYRECWITDLDPDGDGHYHVHDWEPTIYPDKVTVSINTPTVGYGYVQGQLASAIVNGTQLISGSGPKIESTGVGSWWLDLDEMKPKANEAYYTHSVEERTLAPTGLDTKYSWSSSGRGDCYSVYWPGSASVIVTLTSGVTTSHNGVGVATTASLAKGGTVTWNQSRIVQNGEGGSGNGTWKIVYKDRCSVCKDEVDIHAHQRLCNGCLEWYECYKHPGDHIEVSCPQNPSGLYCKYSSYYKCSPHIHDYSSGSSSPTDNTPNCQDCTSDCSTPCSCTNSGTCGGSQASLHPCGQHPSTESGDHSLQASCSSTDSNGNSCTVTNFYACDGHTHSYPSPPPKPKGTTCSGCNATYDPKSSAAAQHTRQTFPCGVHSGRACSNRYTVEHSTPKTCHRCGTTFYSCNRAGPCVTSRYGRHENHSVGRQ